MKVRIKKGVSIGQDFSFFIWPECKPPLKEYLNKEYEYKTTYPNAIFDGTFDEVTNSWICKREGYGSLKTLDEYGNGSIYVRGIDSVEIIQDHEDLENTIKKLRLDDVECHMGRDILRTLYEAHKKLPCCGTLAIVGACIQEIQALREMVAANSTEEDTRL